MIEHHHKITDRIKAWCGFITSIIAKKIVTKVRQNTQFVLATPTNLIWYKYYTCMHCYFSDLDGMQT